VRAQQAILVPHPDLGLAVGKHRPHALLIGSGQRHPVDRTGGRNQPMQAGIQGGDPDAAARVLGDAAHATVAQAAVAAEARLPGAEAIGTGGQLQQPAATAAQPQAAVAIGQRGPQRLLRHAAAAAGNELDALRLAVDHAQQFAETANPVAARRRQQHPRAARQRKQRQRLAARDALAVDAADAPVAGAEPGCAIAPGEAIYRGMRLTGRSGDHRQRGSARIETPQLAIQRHQPDRAIRRAEHVEQMARRFARRLMLRQDATITSNSIRPAP
jgi:hypothetical protein